MSAPIHINSVQQQNQLSQLQLLFRGPLVKDAIVNSLTDLTNLDIRYTYEHKLVWVKDAKTHYYLNDGDGSNISDWSKVSASALIPTYDPMLRFQPNDIVLYLNKLYVASNEVDYGENPIDNKDVWTPISADSVTHRIIFAQNSSKIIYTDIVNPVFEVGTCTFQKDTNDNYIIDTDGLIKAIDYEKIDPVIIRRNDLPNNNGFAYEIQFWENEQPVPLTGVINIR